ncbi:hypothetical protein [Streptomyces sp. BH055]|uniref:hypothetical protein n=1 Tax=Streptomyces sp. BH055 TaxID=3401173 RepID=UPI003BB60D5C
MTTLQRRTRPAHDAEAVTWLESQEPAQAPPWRSDMGPEPAVFTWPHGDRPAMWVQIGPVWRYAPVTGKFEWGDGRVSYAVEVALGERGSSRVHRAYWWPSARLRPAHGSQVPASLSGRGGAYGAMPALHGARSSREARTGRALRRGPGPSQHGG